MSSIFVEVAVVLPVISTYHYRVPPDLSEMVAVGRQILVPFGSRRLTGYILSINNRVPAGAEATIRDILSVTSGDLHFAEAHLPFYRWLSSYYLAPLGRVIQSGLPGGVSTKTRRVASASEAFLDGPPHSGLTSKEGAVLSLLQGSPGLSMGQIRRRLGYHGIDKICRDLGRKGFIVWEDKVQGPRVKPRYRKVVRREETAAAASPNTLKPKEREILSLLAEGPQLLKDLRYAVNNGYYWVRKMVERGLVSLETREVYREPVGGPSVVEPGSRPKLTYHQEQAIRQVSQALKKKSFASFLLHGVTGSGKTEVYLSVTAVAARLGRQSLVLVPEIALTAQMEGLFRHRFQSKVAILHSGLGSGERRDEWVRARRDEVDVVVGARSAVFAPLGRLGLIVVDEEHDSSYKQERGLRYNGRDAAVMRAKFEGAVVLMGSATPALTSYQNALQGKFHLLRLPHRIEQRPLPEVVIVDMRHQRKEELISVPLRRALADALSAGNQSLLLINRRGFANFLLCRGCGHVMSCSNCAVSLTWHRAVMALRCHLCGLDMQVPPLCPQCDTATLKPFGFGTQRVEAEVKKLFPKARVSRMDRDTTRSKQAYRRLLHDLGQGRTDILVGTQMIAKGHDFPKITLVGVVSGDIALKWPDFRAAENTFQILTQVAGRAGRGEDPGTVLVQTYNPEHYSIRFAKEHDYSGFFEEEMVFRKELGYPPYRRLVLFQLSGNVEMKTAEAAQQLAVKCRDLLHERSELFEGLEMLGPVAAPLPKVKGKHRWQLLLKSMRSPPLLEAGRELLNWGQTELRGSGVNLVADVDPVSLI
jgi:primosomal protein N' (replication factor Y)